MRTKTTLLPITALLILFAAGLSEAESKRLLGDLEIGMGVENARQVLPNLELAAAGTPAAQATPAAVTVPLESYRSPDYAFGPAKCSLDLLFHAGVLSRLTGICPDKEATGRELEKRLGAPTERSPDRWFWLGDEIVSFHPGGGVFTLTDKRRNDALQGALFLQLLAGQAKPAADGTPGAAETPKPDAGAPTRP